jgi:hypothetical protein
LSRKKKTKKQIDPVKKVKKIARDVIGQPAPTQVFDDSKKYSRKQKHIKNLDE